MVHAKSSRIEIRTDEQAKRLIEKAANLTGETVSAYMLSKSLSSAKHDIAEMENFLIEEDDRDLFFSLLSNPPKPNTNLKNLMRNSHS